MVFFRCLALTVCLVAAAPAKDKRGLGTGGGVGYTDTFLPKFPGIDVPKKHSDGELLILKTPDVLELNPDKPRFIPKPPGAEEDADATIVHQQEGIDKFPRDKLHLHPGKQYVQRDVIDTPIIEKTIIKQCDCDKHSEEKHLDVPFEQKPTDYVPEESQHDSSVVPAKTDLTVYDSKVDPYDIPVNPDFGLAPSDVPYEPKGEETERRPEEILPAGPEPVNPEANPDQPNPSEYPVPVPIAPEKPSYKPEHPPKPHPDYDYETPKQTENPETPVKTDYPEKPHPKPETDEPKYGSPENPKKPINEPESPESQPALPAGPAVYPQHPVDGHKVPINPHVASNPEDVPTKPYGPKKPVYESPDEVPKKPIDVPAYPEDVPTKPYPHPDKPVREAPEEEPKKTEYPEEVPEKPYNPAGPDHDKPYNPAGPDHDKPYTPVEDHKKTVDFPPPYPKETPKYPVDSPNTPFVPDGVPKQPLDGPAYPTEVKPDIVVPTKPGDGVTIIVEGNPSYKPDGVLIIVKDTPTKVLNEVPVEGSKEPVVPDSYPVEGPKEPGSYPVEGPAAPGSYPVEGPKKPLVPGSYPVEGPKEPLAPGSYPIEGPKEPLAPGSYPVEGPKEPLAPGSYPVEGPKEPLAPGSYPVEGSPKTPVEVPIGKPIEVPDEKPIDVPVVAGNDPYDIPSENPGYPEVPTGVQPGVPVGPEAPAGPGESVPTLGVVCEDMGLRKFLYLLNKAGYRDMLTRKRPLTIFAPSDEAWQRLPLPVLNRLHRDRGFLRRVLRYHLVDGLEGQQVRRDYYCPSMQQGSGLFINTYGKQMYVNGLLATTSPVKPSNGAVYVLQKVMFPFPANSLADAIQSTGTFTRFYTLAAEAGILDKELAGRTPYTLFAPTDEAFSKLPSKTLEWLSWDRAALKDLLLKHLVPGTHYSTFAPDQDEGHLTSLEGANIDFKHAENSGEYSVNGARLLARDLTTKNGVLHAVDKVLYSDDLQPKQFVRPILKRIYS